MTEQYEDAIEMHKRWQGKIEVISRVSVKSAADLSVAYTPGVAKPCLEIEKTRIYPIRIREEAI